MKEEAIKLVECPRDAWQGLPRQIPSELKARYLRGLIDAGFRHLDAVSFVSPKAVPQMADSESVLAALKLPPEVEIIGIVVNEKGAERAITTGKVTTLGFPYSVSPTFLQRNQHQSPNDCRMVLEKVRVRAQEMGLGLVVYISMAFGNPYQDPWSAGQVSEAVASLVASGIRSISLADTAGLATPELIANLLQTVLGANRECEIGVHLHSRRVEAAGKILAAYDAGCRRVDSALGGLGGCPFAQDELVGNIPTEEVLQALEKRGVPSPIGGELEIVADLNRNIGQDFSA
jgi:hydroxymethylglutaryl-CoA lyase